MGDKFRTPEEKFEHRMKSQTSVEACVILALQHRTSWERGLSFEKLKEEVERRKKRDFCKGRIYEAVSLINRYGKKFRVYLRSSQGYVEDDNNKRKIEYRYFVPKEQWDIDNERRYLEHREEIILLKTNSLEHHEKITLPQEQQLENIRN